MSIAISFGLMSNQNILRNCQHLVVKVLRIMLKLKRNAYIDHLYVKCNILNIYDINTFQIGCFMFKAVNGLLSPHLSNLFITNNINLYSPLRVANN